MKPSDSLGRRALHALVLLSAQNLVARALGFASQLILASILVPAQFGLIGITASITALAGSFVNFGVDDIIIQRGRNVNWWSNTLSGLSLASGITTYGIIIIALPLIVHLYSSSTLYYMIALNAMVIPISSMGTTSNMLLRKQLRFKALALYGTFDAIFGISLTLLFAWFGFGAFSVILPSPIMALIRLLFLSVVSGYHFKPTFRLRRWSALVRYSGPSYTTRLLLSVVSQGDYFLLGLMASKEQVGFYYLAFRLSSQPLLLIASSLSSVLFPMLVSVKNDPARLKSATVNSSLLLSFIIFPVSFGQSLVADPLVDLAFGPAWHDAVFPFQALSIGLAFDSVSWISEAMARARGEYRLVMRLVACQTAVFVAIVSVGSYYMHANGAALAVAAYYIFGHPIFTAILYKEIGIGSAQTLYMYALPLSVSIASAALAFVLTNWWFGSAGDLITIASRLIFFSASYLLLSSWFAPRILDQVQERVRAAIFR